MGFKGPLKCDYSELFQGLENHSREGIELVAC